MLEQPKAGAKGEPPATSRPALSFTQAIGGLFSSFDLLRTAISSLEIRIVREIGRGGIMIGGFQMIIDGSERRSALMNTIY